MPSLFIALFPPERIARQIAADAATWPLRPASFITPERLHVTVAYLGDRGDDPAAIAAAASVLAELVALPVDAEFGALRIFGAGRARPAVITGQFSNPWIRELRAQLLPALERAGVLADARRDFEPHITVAYSGAVPPLVAVGPYCFQSRELALVRGGDYAVLARRALSPPAGTVEHFTPWFRDPLPPGDPVPRVVLDELAGR